MSISRVYATGLILKCVSGKPKCCPIFFNPPWTHGGLEKIHKTPTKQTYMNHRDN